MTHVSDSSKIDASVSGAEAVPDERYLVPALVRGLSILGKLSAANGNPTLSEVAALLGVTRSSAYRLLYTLGHLGFVEYDARTKTYALGPQVLALGYGYLASRDITDVAMPHLERLRDRTGWSAHLGELHNREVVYLARVATRRMVSSTVHVGTRLPAHATTMGRILLSGLSDDEIRARYQEDMARPVDLSPFSRHHRIAGAGWCRSRQRRCRSEFRLRAGCRQRRGADPRCDRSHRRGDQRLGGRAVDFRRRAQRPAEGRSGFRRRNDIAGSGTAKRAVNKRLEGRQHAGQYCQYD